MTKSLIYVLCGLGLLAGIFGLWLGLAKIRMPSDAGAFLTASAILTAGSLIAVAIACTADSKNGKRSSSVE